MNKKIMVIGVFLCFFGSFIYPVIAEEPPSTYTPYFPSYPPLTPQEMMEFARQGAEYLENGGDINPKSCIY